MANPAKVPRELYMPLRRPRSLLVEDQVEQLDRRRELLRLRNLDVIPATSKAEAIGRLRSVNFRVDVVVTDLNLESGEGTLEGIDVAAVVNDVSGRSIPVYAYSGKTQGLPNDVRRLFVEVLLKSETSKDARGLFARAAQNAFSHFEDRAERAQVVIEKVREEPKPLPDADVTLLRDMIAGTTLLGEGPLTYPEAVGLLLVPEGGALPYGIESRQGSEGRRVYASVLGHEYLYGVGADEERAVRALDDVMAGASQMVEDDRRAAVGPSRRMRRLLRVIGEHIEGTD